jgi:hypothetical protein
VSDFAPAILLSYYRGAIIGIVQHVVQLLFISTTRGFLSPDALKKIDPEAAAKAGVQ